MNITIDFLSANSIVTISCIVFIVLGIVFGNSEKKTARMFFLLPIFLFILIMYWVFVLSHVIFWLLLTFFIIVFIFGIIDDNINADRYASGPNRGKRK